MKGMTVLRDYSQKILSSISRAGRTMALVCGAASVAIMLGGCVISVDMKPVNIYEGKDVSLEAGQIEKLPLRAVIVLDEHEVYTTMLWQHGTLDGNCRYHYPVGELIKNSAAAYLGQLFDVKKVAGELPSDVAYDLAIFMEVRKMRTEDFGNGCAVTADIAYKLLDSDFSWQSPFIEITATGKKAFDSLFLRSLPEVCAPAAAQAVDEGVKSIVLSLYKSLKHPEQLLSLARKVVAANPAHVEGYLLLGNVSNKYGHYDDAVSASRRAAELQPDNDAAYLNMGHAYAALKKYDDAITAYKKAIELNLKSPIAYIQLAKVYWYKENYNEAVNTYKKGLEINPNNTKLYAVLTRTYMAMGKYDDAIETTNKAIALETITGIGTNIAIEDNYPVVKRLIQNAPAMRAGIQVGDKIVKINGQSTKRWDVKKVVQNIKGAEGTQVTLTIKRKGETFEKSLKRETVIFKEAAPYFAFRSLAYREKGNLENAIKDAEKAYSLDSNDNEAKSAMSITYIDKGKYNDALKILSAIKDSSFDRMLEATAYAKLGDMKKTVEIYTSIPEDYLASKSVLRQSYKKALLASLTPYMNAKKDYAKSLEAKGQYRDALKEYAEAIKLADDRDAKEIRAQIAAIVKKNPYLSQIPEEARKYALRGEVLLKDGKFEEALKEYKEAIKYAPYIALLYRTTALVYGELKEYAQAINYMNIYLDLMPDAPDARAVKDQIYKWEFMMEKGGK